MITSAILYVIAGAFRILMVPIRNLSDVSLPENISSSIADAVGKINSLSFALPISTIFAILGLLIGIEVSVFTYKTVMWLIKRLPTQS